MLGVDVRIGLKPQGLGSFDDCTSVWDGLVYLFSEVQDLIQQLLHTKRMSQDIASTLEENTKVFIKKSVEHVARKTDTTLKLMESNIRKLVDFVTALNSEQEKLAERSLLQNTQSSAFYADLVSAEVKNVHHLKLCQAMLDLVVQRLEHIRHS